MTKSLESGISKLMPIRMPKSLMDRIKRCLRDGETVSELTRRFWERECQRREKAAEKKSGG